MNFTERDGARKKIIAFVNSKAGGLQGQAVINGLINQIGAENVYDLVIDHGPEKGLEQNQYEKDLRIIACGGDGTVGWVLSALDKFQIQYADFISVGVIPLGTGNDMARFLGMGPGYQGENLSELIQTLSKSETTMLDRWLVEVTPITQSPPIGPGNDTGVSNIKLPLSVFNNYLSFGADAQIALTFHQQRNANPTMFANRFFNKAAYGVISSLTFFDERYLCGHIAGDVELTVDGNNVYNELVASEPDAILILNISSYAAGSNPWQGVPNTLMDGTWTDTDGDQFREQSCSDGYLEIVSVKHFELAQIQLGGRGRRLAQG
ncbi:unnamed protein product [Didymodactylos carnosus]|nr:unnamed protein product [Didymodactylos carnosus]CAF3546524.1 unnamed protein product [Didymodactylos carnosus]